MKDMGLKTAVIITSYNTRQDTLECLASVYRIGYPDYEVIVVDNGSTDGSVEAVRSAFPGAVVIANRTNTGFCAANNLGIKTAQERGAKYLLILNSDTVVEPSIISELKDVVDADPRIGAVTPVITYYHKPDAIQFKGATIDWGNGAGFGKYGARDLEANTVLDNDMVIWCAVFMKTDVVDVVGYLDEKFFLYYEDIDWSIRCAGAGLRTVVYTRKLVRHKGSLSSGGAYSPNFNFYYWRNRLLVMQKHAPFMRKIQFSINYVADCTKNYTELRAKGETAAADAVADGLWSALNGVFYDKRVPMPSGIKDNLNLFIKPYLFFRALGAVLYAGGTTGECCRRGS